MEPMKRSFGVLVIAVVASMAMAGMALAQDHDVPIEQELLTPTVFVDEATGTVYIGIPPEIPDPDNPFECLPVEDPEGEGGEGEGAEPAEGPADIDEGEGGGDDGELVVMHMPGDCIELVIDPDRKMNHGAVVSTVAKGLHPSTLKESGYKKGEIMRCAAKHNKADAKDCTFPVVNGEGEAEGADDGDDDGVEPEAELDKADKPRGKSENARNKDKPNKGKKNR